jgi:putative toxin-antitoxin system antitoxin component (TIGR02293 family)
MGNPALAEILGCEEKTPVEIVEQGLPFSSVERLAKTLSLTLEEFCDLIPVSRRTLARYRSGSLDSHLSDHVMMIGEVYERAEEVMESPANALLWLKAPNYAFRFKRPLDYLTSFTGAQEVLDELGRLQHGIFV